MWGRAGRRGGSLCGQRVRWSEASRSAGDLAAKAVLKPLRCRIARTSQDKASPQAFTQRVYSVMRVSASGGGPSSFCQGGHACGLSIGRIQSAAGRTGVGGRGGTGDNETTVAPSHDSPSDCWYCACDRQVRGWTM
jgi:hypothetical protein